MKDKEIKYNEKTKFSILREVIVNRIVDPDGQVFIQKGYVEETPPQDMPFNLGSLSKPKDKSIIELKWIIVKKKKYS